MYDSIIIINENNGIAYVTGSCQRVSILFMKH
jgi:hypothetical protein